MQTEAENGGPEINLAQQRPGLSDLTIAGADMPRAPDYPDLYLKGDHPGLAEIPESGHATIKFDKHSHEVTKHPITGKKTHRVVLNVKSFKCHNAKKKIKDKNPFGVTPKV